MPRRSALILKTIGAVLIALSIVYFITPSGNLPAMMPGHTASGTGIATFFGIVTFLAGLGIILLSFLKRMSRGNLAADPTMTDDEVDYE